QSLPQPGLADFANRQVLSFVPRVAETHFPIPCLEVIGNPSHLTPQANIEQLIPIGELFTSRTGIVNTAEANPRGDWETDSTRKEVWNGCIPNRERVPCIKRKDWHTD